MSGLVDETTNVILGRISRCFKGEILGIWVEEMDYLGEESNEVEFYRRPTIPG